MGYEKTRRNKTHVTHQPPELPRHLCLHKGVLEVSGVPYYEHKRATKLRDMRIIRTDCGNAKRVAI